MLSRRYFRRPAVLTLAIAAVCGGVLLAGGCAESHSRQWAVNGPILKPDAQPARDVLLGASADRPAANDRDDHRAP